MLRCHGYGGTILSALELEKLLFCPVSGMALTERPPSEEESLSTFSRIDSFLSESSEPAGYGGSGNISS